MRLETLEFSGFGPFADPVKIDLTKIDGMLIALVGTNGAGKSTLAELALPGAMYRACPSRGSLAKLATSRDARLKVGLMNGRRWDIEHLVDGVSGESEAIVTDDQGRTVLESTSVRQFDAWAKLTFPTREVLYSTTFAKQGSRGFLALGPAERKAVLSRLLGIEAYEARIKDAHARAAKEQAAKVVVLSRCQELGDVGVAGAEARLAEAQAVAASTAATRATLAENLKRARELHAQCLSQDAAHKAARAEVDALYRTLAEASNRARLLASREFACKAVLSQNDAIRAAVAADATLAARLEKAEATLTQANSRAVEGSTAFARAQDRHQSLVRAKAAAKGRLDLAEVRGKDDARVAEAERARDAAQTLVVQLEAERDQLMESQRALGSRALVGAEGRVGYLRGKLADIAALDVIESEAYEKALDAVGTARIALERDGLTELEATETPALLRAGSVKLTDVVLKLTNARADHHHWQSLAAKRSAIDEAKLAAEAARAELECLTREVDEATRAVDAAAAAAHPLCLAMDEAAREVAHVKTERAALAPLVAQQDILARVETRLEEVRPQLEAAREEEAKLQATLRAVRIPEAVSDWPNVEGMQSALDLAEKEERQWQARLAVEDARAASVRAAAARWVTLNEEADTHADHAADWTRLAKDLDAVKLLEIDAAGPDLTARANALLRQCHGPRWSVRIETSRLTADGKKTVDDCPVYVTDNTTGREDEAETFSGGENVIVGLAVSLALTVVACQRWKVLKPTLVRDEEGAALSPENAEAYVAMLRLAAEWIGAGHVLLVSHDPHVQSLADVRLNVADGHVEVQS